MTDYWYGLYSRGGYIKSRVAKMGPDGLSFKDSEQEILAYRVGNRWAVGKPIWTGYGWLHDYIFTREDIEAWKKEFPVWLDTTPEPR